MVLSITYSSCCYRAGCGVAILVVDLPVADLLLTFQGLSMRTSNFARHVCTILLPLCYAFSLFINILSLQGFKASRVAAITSAEPILHFDFEISHRLGTRMAIWYHLFGTTSARGISSENLRPNFRAWETLQYTKSNLKIYSAVLSFVLVFTSMSFNHPLAQNHFDPLQAIHHA